MRQVLIRNVVFLIVTFAVCGSTQFALMLAIQSRRDGADELLNGEVKVDPAELHECEDELQRARVQLEQHRSAALSRRIPLEILKALQEGLPASVWILSVRGEGPAIRIHGRAPSEGDIRATVLSLESSHVVTEVQLASTKSTEGVALEGAIEFEIGAHVKLRGD